MEGEGDNEGAEVLQVVLGRENDDWLRERRLVSDLSISRTDQQSSWESAIPDVQELCAKRKCWIREDTSCCHYLKGTKCQRDYECAEDIKERKRECVNKQRMVCEMRACWIREGASHCHHLKRISVRDMKTQTDSD